MGYDMYVVGESGEFVGCDDPTHEHYWRRNIWGGSTQAEKLVDAGMGYWAAGTDRGFPEEPPGAEWVENDYGDEPNNELAEGYEQAVLQYLRDTRDERPGISVYKLCSTNDGWWVTKAECQTALELWELGGKPEVDDYGDTIPFLRTAAEHDGFRVW